MMLNGPLYEKEGVSYFSSNIELGPSGVEKIYDVGKITDYEQKLIKEALPVLKQNIQKGIEFAADWYFIKSLFLYSQNLLLFSIMI